MTIELSVIIVNYNGLKFLQDCLSSLKERLKDVSHEIIIVDNNSADGSSAYIKEYFPEVVLVESGENLGFGKGNNVGAQKARGEYLLLINNDTIVQDDISGVLETLKENEDIGAAGIKMLNGEKNYLLSVGKFPRALTLTRIKNISHLSSEFASGNFTKNSYDVDWISGSFLMLPKKLYDKVNGFDEDYFMYVEDVDICKKIANLGLRRVFLPQYSYIHFVGYDKSKDPLIIKGWEMFLKKHFTGVKKTVALGAIGINKSVKFVKKILQQ